MNRLELSMWIAEVLGQSKHVLWEQMVSWSLKWMKLRGVGLLLFEVPSEDAIDCGVEKGLFWRHASFEAFRKVLSR